jgi:ferredoxin--NADP+ reductase
VVEAGLVFRAIGYRGEPVPGVPYDDRRGIVPNADGRVKASTDGDVVPCEYVVGWAKRGPTGLIGTNKNCSAATVDLMVEDLPALEARPAAHPEAAEKILRERGARFVTFDDWRHLDALERERGEKAGRIRDRFSRVEEMLEAIDRARSASP